MLRAPVGHAITGAHPRTAPDSGRAKLLLCLECSAGEQRGISDRTSKNIASLVLGQLGRRGSDALASEFFIAPMPMPAIQTDFNLHSPRPIWSSKPRSRNTWSC